MPKKRKGKKQPTKYQILLRVHLLEIGLSTTFEHKFCATRKWHFDLADLEHRIGFECNGGKRSGGHRRGDAIDDENEKLNTAQLMGWRVLQFTNEEIDNGNALAFLKKWI